MRGGGALIVLRQRLDQRQVQKLILAPALQQAIKLLPLTNLELIEVIDEELTENPMMELEEEAETGPPESAEEQASANAEPEAGEPEKAPEEAREAEPPDEAFAISEPPKSPDEVEKVEAEASFQDYLDDGFRPNFGEKREAVSLENTLSRSPSLWDHLNWQASLTFFEPEEREIAQFDHRERQRGRLSRLPGGGDREARPGGPGKGRGDPAKDHRPSIPSASPASTSGRPSSPRWTTSRSGTRSPGRSSADHLPLLEKSDYAQLARILAIPLAEVKDHIEIIRSLDPAPGRKYAEEKTFYVVPDIIVTKEGDEWKVVAERRRPAPAPDLRLLQTAPGPGVPGPPRGHAVPQGPAEEGPLVHAQPGPAEPDDLPGGPLHRGPAEGFLR